MVKHYPIVLRARPQGFHLITAEVLAQLPELPETGILQLFIRHTSAGICINENADPDVLHDFELFFERLAPEDMPGLRHTLEGPDDMPAHIKAVLTGSSVSIPIADGKLALGTWQGIYLGEFRRRGGSRKLLASVYQ
ncbi:MAG TPA: YjbQ family protein [Phaeodactylibacter sp.]|nr:YjbQ family protein [Phaeodactylibacter sp.]